jgi:hypothetical protein
MLAILSVGAAAAPLVWLVTAFLQATGRAAAVMALQFVSLLAVLGAVAALAQIGPLWACAGVGAGTAAAVAVAAALVRAATGVPAAKLLATAAGPLLACAPMVGAVLGVRAVLARVGGGAGYLGLGAEVLAGALAYCLAALVCAAPVARDFLRLADAAFLRRRARAVSPVAAGAEP